MPYPGGADLTIEDSSGDSELSLNWLKDGRLAISLRTPLDDWEAPEINLRPDQIQRIAAALVEGMKDAAGPSPYTTGIFLDHVGEIRPLSFDAAQIGSLRALLASIEDRLNAGRLGDAAKLLESAKEIAFLNPPFDFDKSKAAPPPGDGGNGAGSAQDAGAPAAAKP